MEFNGYRLIETAAMVINVKRAAVRSWRERLLGWPWNPCCTIKFYAKAIPRQDILLNEETRTAIMHPNVAQAIRAAMAQEALNLEAGDGPVGQGVDFLNLQAKIDEAKGK